MNFKKALLILFSLFFFSSQIFAKEVKFAFLTDISLNNSNSDYLKETIKACDFTLTRQEWYDLYLASEKPLP